MLRVHCCSDYHDTVIPGNKSRPRNSGVLLGIHEVAKRFGVQRSTVDQWRRRDLLPTPDFDLHGGPVWWSGTIEVWARKTGR